MRRVKILGLISLALLAISGASSTSALASKYLQIYEPLRETVVPPAPVALRAPYETGFGFFIGSRSGGYGNVAQCAGEFGGTLESNNKSSDKVKLTGVDVGRDGFCGEFGRAGVAILGFPFTLDINTAGKAKFGPTMTVELEEVSGLPELCVYSGAAKISNVTIGTELTMELNAYMKSKTHGCDELLFRIGVLTAFGSSEALYTAVR